MAIVIAMLARGRPIAVVVFSLMFGIALSLSGLLQIAGINLSPEVVHILPFAAIIVAFVGRLNPVGILFASLLMALLYLGGEQAQHQDRQVEALLDVEIGDLVDAMENGCMVFSAELAATRLDRANLLANPDALLGRYAMVEARRDPAFRERVRESAARVVALIRPWPMSRMSRLRKSSR